MGEGCVITEMDLAELWRRNPLALEQAKVIVLERLLGDATKKLAEKCGS